MRCTSLFSRLFFNSLLATALCHALYSLLSALWSLPLVHCPLPLACSSLFDPWTSSVFPRLFALFLRSVLTHPLHVPVLSPVLSLALCPCSLACSLPLLFATLFTHCSPVFGRGPLFIVACPWLALRCSIPGRPRSLHGFLPSSCALF